MAARFDGGRITSDGAGLLLGQVERATGISRRFAACFTDHRDPDLIEHTVEQLIAQRVYALVVGYEDLSDHDDLRHDPLLAILVGKEDPLGRDRPRTSSGRCTPILSSGARFRCAADCGGMGHTVHKLETPTGLVRADQGSRA